MRLTAKDRLLLHLLDHARYAEALDVPGSMTPAGIARAIGVEERHVPQSVRPLIRDGLVRERTAHIQGGRQRRKVYDLTTSGRTEAIRLREAVLGETVQVRDASGVHQMSVAQILRDGGWKASLLELLRQAGETGTLDLATPIADSGAAAPITVPQATRLEQEFHWMEASAAYRGALASLRPDDSPRRGRLLEASGYDLFRAALQAPDEAEFARRIDDAAESYERAAAAFGSDSRSGDSAYKLRCDAMLSYLALWRAATPSEKKRAAEHAWGLTKKALDAFLARGPPEEVRRTFNRLVTCVDFANALEWEATTKEARVREAVQYGERAVEAEAPGGDPRELAQCRAKTSWHVLHLAFRATNQDERRQHTERALDLRRRAFEVSEAVTLLELPWFETFSGTGLDVGMEPEIGRVRKMLELARRTDDRFLIGFALAWLGYHLGFQVEPIDGPDERLAIRNRALEFVREAKDQLSRIRVSPPCTGGYWADSPEAYHYHEIAMDAPDPARRHEFLERALRAVPEGLSAGERTGYPYAIAYSHWRASVTLAEVARSERDPTKERSLLEASLGHLNEASRIVSAIEPQAAWELGMGEGDLALIKLELAKLAPDAGTKTNLIREAIAAEARALEQCRPGATIPPNIAMVARFPFDRGGMLTDLHRLTESRDSLKEAAKAFEEAAELYQKTGLVSRVAECHWKAGQTFDALADHTKAAAEFASASETYKLAAERVPQLKDVYADHAIYMQAWSEIERAKHHHARGEYGAAKDFYERAATLHRFSRARESMATNYAAWARLEAAEDLSRSERDADAIGAFGRAADLFRDAGVALEASLPTIRDAEERQMAEDLIRAAGRRRRYCSARTALEGAKVLDRRGQYTSSSDEYGRAAEALEGLAAEGESERDRKDLTLIATLARAWQAMATAEAGASPEAFGRAAALFETVKDLSSDERATTLALGHSRFCNALEMGTRYADSRDPTLYSAALKHLDSAANFYARAGATGASEYARASRLLLDAYAAMDRAGQEPEPGRKAKAYRMTEKVLEASAAAFGAAGQPAKRDQVQRLADNVRRERELAESLTAVFQAPQIVSSTAAFATPGATFEQPVGLERFQHADVRASLILAARSLAVGEELGLTLELVNAGRSAGHLIKVEGLIPEGFELEGRPERYEVKDRFLDLRGRRLEPLKTETVRMVLRANSPGTVRLTPRIMFLDETGAYKYHEPEPVEVEVHA